MLSVHFVLAVGAQRWLNHLDSTLTKSDWTADEDAVLLDAQRRVGNKWSEVGPTPPTLGQSDGGSQCRADGQTEEASAGRGDLRAKA